MNGLQTCLDNNLPRLVTGGDEENPGEVFVAVLDGLDNEDDGATATDADIAGSGVEMILDGLTGSIFFGFFNGIGHWMQRKVSTYRGSVSEGE